MSAVTFCFSSKVVFNSFNRAIAASTAACNLHLCCLRIYTHELAPTILRNSSSPSGQSKADQHGTASITLSDFPSFS